jgi:hypothetical protein
MFEGLEMDFGLKIESSAFFNETFSRFEGDSLQLSHLIVKPTRLSYKTISFVSGINLGKIFV